MNEVYAVLGQSLGFSEKLALSLMLEVLLLCLGCAWIALLGD